MKLKNTKFKEKSRGLECKEGGDPSRNEDRDTYVRKFLKVHALESRTFAFNFLALIVKLEILSYLEVAQML